MSQRSILRRLAAIAVAVAVAACGTPTDFVANAGQALIGTWSSDNAVFAASDAGATLNVPCVSVSFPPVVLDDTAGFSIVGVVAAATGLVTAKVGDPWVISGHAEGKTLVMNSPMIGTQTLSLGGGDRTLVCNS